MIRKKIILCVAMILLLLVSFQTGFAQEGNDSKEKSPSSFFAFIENGLAKIKNAITRKKKTNWYKTEEMPRIKMVRGKKNYLDSIQWDEIWRLKTSTHPDSVSGLVLYISQNQRTIALVMYSRIMYPGNAVLLIANTDVNDISDFIIAELREHNYPHINKLPKLKERRENEQ